MHSLLPLVLCLSVITTSYMTYVTSQCVEPGNMEMSLQERLYQADIILYGKDRALDGQCPAEDPNCARAPSNAREYSNFQVYCVIKNTDGISIPNNITIFPRKFGDKCSQTTFSSGVSGWVHIVTVRYDEGRYYWDEINNMAAYSTVYIVNTDEKLQKASRLCNLPLPVLPEGGSDVGCPAVFNRSRNPATCFKGCERGWKPIGGGCYWFSSPSTPVTRNEAAVSCLLQDSHLLAIETQEEETSLTYVLNDHVDTEWWSGGTWGTGAWVWQDGVQDRALTFTKWRRGEPAGQRGETDYVVVLYRRDKWGWRAVGPDTKLPFICEKVRGELPPITLSVCQDRGLQSTAEGKALCSLAVQKVLLTSNSLWPANVTSRVTDMCRGKTPYDDINCLRDVRRGQNFVSHFLGRSAFNPYMPRQELSLIFASLPGYLLVCGQQYSWPRTVIVTPHLGDQKTYDSWYFREESKMEVRWDAASDQLYSLIIIDLGLFAVHGAWVNIPGGNLTDAKVIQPYVPLAVATPEVPASFAFMVFRQKSPAFLTDAILKMLTYSPGRHDDFNLTELSREIGFEDLVAVNFVTVEWDPFSAWYFQNRPGFSNHCPTYVQMAYRDLNAPVLQSQTPFSLVMDVAFQAGQQAWTMCCKQFSVSETFRRLTPYGSETVAMTTENVRLAPTMNLTRGNVLLDGRDRQQIFRGQVSAGQIGDFPLSNSRGRTNAMPASNSLGLHWCIMSTLRDCINPVGLTVQLDDWYTVVLVDLGILPNSAPPGLPSKPRLHWLVIDVPDGDVTSGKTIVPYKMPAPLDKYRHFYVIYALKQKNKLSTVNVQKFASENCTSSIRCAFDLTGFIQFYEIQIAGANWFTVEADTYTIYELIKTKMATPADACKLRFPETRTFGPLVVCDTPPPQQPSVRPIVSAAPWVDASQLTLLLLTPSVLVVNWILVAANFGNV